MLGVPAGGRLRITNISCHDESHSSEKYHPFWPRADAKQPRNLRSLPHRNGWHHRSRDRRRTGDSSCVSLATNASSERSMTPVSGRSPGSTFSSDSRGINRSPSQNGPNNSWLWGTLRSSKQLLGHWPASTFSSDMIP